MARTTYYVDAGATGTGDGLSPANAFVSVLSVPFITVNTVDITAWVRRTHNETLTTSQYLGANWTFDQWPNWKAVIGWPTAGDPHYTQRPAAGQSAWDADVAGHTVGSLGGNVPTFTYSSAAGSMLCGVGFFANLAIQNEGGPALIGKNGTAGNGAAKYTSFADNIWLLGPTTQSGKVRTAPGSLQMNFGKLTMAFSAGLGSDAIFQQGISGPFDIRHFVVHSTSITSGGFFPQGSAVNIHLGVFQNDSSSINLWAGGSTLRGIVAEAFSNRVGIWIERAIGHKPFAAVPYAFVSGMIEMRFDDYFGEGPRLERIYDYVTRVASSGEAQHNGKQVVLTNVGSRSPSGSFTWASYNDDSARWPDIRKRFDVVSGTPLTINLPVYISSAQPYSLSLGAARGGMLMLGGDFTFADSTNVVAGSYTNWTGSLIAGGSAYLFGATFTPKETGTFEFEFYKGWYTIATSQTILNGYALFGEPEKV